MVAASAPLCHALLIYTAQKIKFSIKDFFSKCDQIRSFLRFWSYLLKKSFMENFIFCVVLLLPFLYKEYFVWILYFHDLPLTSLNFACLFFPVFSIQLLKGFWRLAWIFGKVYLKEILCLGFEFYLRCDIVGYCG